MIVVGKKYRNNSNEVVTIVDEDPTSYNGRRVFIDQISRSYFEDGKYFYGYRPLDLKEEVNVDN